MSPLHSARATRRGVTALLVAAALALGATVLVPSAGADPLADKRAEAARVASQLESLQSRQQDLAAQAERVGYEQHQAEEAVKEAQRLVDQTESELEAKRAAVRRVAVEAFQKGNDSPELDALLTSDATTGVQKKVYIESGTGDIKDAIDQLGAAQQRANDDKARLEEAQKAVDAKAAELAQLKAANDRAVADAAALQSKVQGELATLVAAEQARRAEEQRIAAERAAAAAAAARPQAAPTANNGGGGTGGGGTTNRNTGGGGGGGGGVVVPAVPNPPAPGGGASGAIAAALSKVGSRPYVWGAAGPSVFDCSGLVMWAYAQVGVRLPHYSGAQYNMTTRISRSQLQPGDLVFWGPGGSEHVALYIGGNQLVHSFGSGNGVNVTHLDGWWKAPSGYGRLNY